MGLTPGATATYSESISESRGGVVGRLEAEHVLTVLSVDESEYRVLQKTSIRTAVGIYEGLAGDLEFEYTIGRHTHVADSSLEGAFFPYVAALSLEGSMILTSDRDIDPGDDWEIDGAHFSATRVVRHGQEMVEVIVDSASTKGSMMMNLDQWPYLVEQVVFASYGDHGEEAGREEVTYISKDPLRETPEPPLVDSHHALLGGFRKVKITLGGQ